MQDDGNSLLPTPKRIPWNKGKLTGAKPPLRQKHVWAIPTKLQAEAIIMQWIDAPLWRSEIPDVSLA